MSKETEESEKLNLIAKMSELSGELMKFLVVSELPADVSSKLHAGVVNINELSIYLANKK